MTKDYELALKEADKVSKFFNKNKNQIQDYLVDACGGIVYNCEKPFFAVLFNDSSYAESVLNDLIDMELDGGINIGFINNEGKVELIGWF